MHIEKCAYLFPEKRTKQTACDSKNTNMTSTDVTAVFVLLAQVGLGSIVMLMSMPSVNETFVYIISKY